MNTSHQIRPKTMHTFSITVDVDPHWVEYLTDDSVVFDARYAGYWLRGVEWARGLGWLVWEDDERHRWGTEPDRAAAREAWRAGRLLPAGWYRLDRAAALRAWEAGVRTWGVGWYGHVDAQREDIVLQQALLGEVRYG
jgi:hypothetical protein